MRITLSDQKFLLLFYTIIETHLMNTFNVMPNYLTVSNNTILVRVLDTGIVYISSDGSYTTMKLINGEEYTFSFNLSAFEKIIEQTIKRPCQYIYSSRQKSCDKQQLHICNKYQQTRTYTC